MPLKSLDVLLVDAAPRRPATRPAWYAGAPFVLYGLTGFTGLLAEQGFEKYIALLVGVTASASAVEPRSGSYS